MSYTMIDLELFDGSCESAFESNGMCNYII